MTAGTEIKCMNEEDMLEIMRYIRERGGEIICEDWEMKVLKIIRGTENEKKTMYNADGVLGIVDTSHAEREDAEQKRRSELFRNPEGDLLQLGYEQDLRTR